MRNSNKNEPKRFGVKALVLTGAATLALTATVGGTLAWLIASETVTNTFTYGDINIELTETDTGLDADDNDKTNTYEMVPGNSIEKDPKITVEADSEDCYLFVQLDKSANFDDFMTYEIAENWEPVKDAENVYYLAINDNNIVDSTVHGDEIEVLLNNEVKVKEDVTKKMFNDLDKNEVNYPTLTIKAYGVQYDAADSVEEAWKLAQEQEEE